MALRGISEAAHGSAKISNLGQNGISANTPVDPAVPVGCENGKGRHPFRKAMLLEEPKNVLNRPIVNAHCRSERSMHNSLPFRCSHNEVVPSVESTRLGLIDHFSAPYGVVNDRYQTGPVSTKAIFLFRPFLTGLAAMIPSSRATAQY
jgi:hypothetical protein